MTSPHDNLTPPPPPPRKPSGGVTALGIINIVYSTIFYLCCGFSAIASPLFSSAMQQFAEQQGVTDYQPSAAVQAYSLVNGIIIITLGICLLIGGIGLLRLKPWGRSLSMGAAAGIIAWVLIAFVINILFIFPAQREFMGEDLTQQQYVLITIVSGVFGAFMQIIYPIILLILLNVNSIKNQFIEEQGGPVY